MYSYKASSSFCCSEVLGGKGSGTSVKAFGNTCKLQQLDLAYVHDFFCLFPEIVLDHAAEFSFSKAMLTVPPNIIFIHISIQFLIVSTSLSIKHMELVLHCPPQSSFHCSRCFCVVI